MAATKVPDDYAKVDQGAQWSLQVTMQDSLGAAINNAGYTAKFQLREKPSTSSPAVLSLSEAGGITMAGASGVFTITATGAQTGTIPAGTYYGDLYVTSPGGVVTALVWSDNFVVRPAVSH